MVDNEAVINKILGNSSLLLENISSSEPVFHNLIIKSHLEEILNSGDDYKVDIDLPSGLDWINVDKPICLEVEKIKVLDFFTYCCVNCIHVLPQLKALESKYSIDDGVVVIGVHSPKFANERSTTNVKAAVRRYDITHPVVNDYDEHLWKALRITCWPTLVVIGPHQQLLLYLMGETHKDVLHMFVEETLKFCKEKRWVSTHSIGAVLTPLKSQEKQTLFFPGKVAVNGIGSDLKIAVADTAHHRVLILNTTGEVKHAIGCGKSGFVNGGFGVAQFHSPQGLAFQDANILYVADTENHAIRKVDLLNRYVETIAGTGVQGHDLIGGKIGTMQPISSPWDLVFYNKSVILIAMAGIHQIWAYFFEATDLWKKTHPAKTCAAVVGSGREENRNNSYPMKAGLAQPSGVTVTADGKTIYVADSESSTVRAISSNDGSVTNVVGGLPDPLDLFGFGDTDGVGLSAKLQHPLGIVWSEHKKAIFICDSYNHKLKMIEPATRECVTVPGIMLNEPGGLCVAENFLYVADTNNHCIKTLNINTLETHRIAIKHQSIEASRPVKEIETSINTRGGRLDLNVTIFPSESIKLSQELPIQWSIEFPDCCLHIKSKEGKHDKTWRIFIPESKYGNSSCQLKPKCKLFYCHNNLCTQQTLTFLVTVLYKDTAPDEVSCSLLHAHDVK